MTSESLPDQSLSPHEASETPEIVDANSLPERFGFEETEEMRQLKPGLMEASSTNDAERFRILMNEYHLLAQQQVEEKQVTAYTKAQIGLIVAMGLIRRDAERIESYLYDLTDALTYARHMGYHHEVARLIAEVTDNVLKTHYGAEKPPISYEIAAILYGLGEGWGFDSITCAEIAEMPFEDAFETAYGYLTQAELDADEILAQFTEVDE